MKKLFKQIVVVGSLLGVFSSCSPVFAADVQVALANTFGHEGGYQCLRADSGNWTGGRIGVGELKGTKYGIAAASYPHEDIKNLKIERAADLYERDFWRPLGLHKVRSQVIANEVFDAAVNMGTGTEARIFQQAINQAGFPRKKITVDGQIGPATIARANEIDQVALYCHLIGMRYGRYSFIVNGNPIKEQFFRTWVYRIKDNVTDTVLATAKTR